MLEVLICASSWQMACILRSAFGIIITVIPFEIKDAGMCKENPTDSAHRQLYIQTTAHPTLSLTPYISRKFKRLTDPMLFSSIPC